MTSAAPPFKAQRVRIPSGTTWKAQQSHDGEEVELARWQEAPIPANGAGAVVVGIEGERAQLGCPCTLKLWEATGPRTVTLGNVTCPDGKAKAP